ncbi:MAG: WYL domain-containing protein [Muribaculaceae bacterium]|nr:WYL domain-containing protein [Muribaculaceae bacterium]
MPTNKGALVRRQVLDGCLSSRQEYTLRQLMEKCNDVLRDKGFKLVTSENTIHTDMFEMEAQYPQAEIISYKKGRNVFYRYKDKGFSIYKLPLTNEEILGLTQALSVLSRFDGMPGYEWLDNIVERFKPYINIDSNVKNLVSFDENIQLKGREHFSRLLNAIATKEVLLIRYSGYNNPQEIKAIIHPYFIKEYNNRWFLFAYNEEADKISNFAFDRILELTSIPKNFIENTTTDFNHFFDDMIGVSRNEGDVPQEIHLFISQAQLPYILSKPLHISQKIIDKTPEGAVISIKVIFNFELEQKILSLGENVIILKPNELREKIKYRIFEMTKKYQ